MMARGLAKLRKRITTENECAERPLLALSPGEKNSPLKRVQFGETSFSQEREDERGDSEYVFFFFFFFNSQQHPEFGEK